MYSLLRRALFTSPPEMAHELALDGLKFGSAFGLNKALYPEPGPLSVNVFGLDFANPVGLAAGMDKNGDYIDALGSLGFGFIEVGTVTPRPQPGNAKPRVFRVPQARALINRLGFNNKGVDHLVNQVRQRRYRGVLGINIGKNADTPIERAVDDYLVCLEKVYSHADYVAVNISSPNTTGLRSLQSEQALDDLLSKLLGRRDQLAAEADKQVPMLIKIAPDLEQHAVVEMAEIFNHHKIDGLIATNTTIDRTAVADLEHGAESGGLSGAPLFDLANTILTDFRTALDPGIPIIGVGGVCDAKDAAQKFVNGASLVQFYTGFIYAGPALIGEAVNAIRDHLGGGE
jgi:dihydroorotate dehydrogenase